MLGGHGGRLFFSGQVLEYSKRLVDELPTQEYTIEEQQAGFEEISKAFGFYATLDSIARYVNEPDESVIKWSVIKFYSKLKLLAWKEDAKKKYRKILNPDSNEANL